MRFLVFLLCTISSQLIFGQKTVSNAQAIKSTVLNRSESNFIKLEGYYSPNDGGEGVLELIDRGKINPDFGIYFPAADKNKVWRRVVSSSNINVKWFGVKADGTFVDAPALQRALDYAAENMSSVSFPPGGIVKDTKGNITYNYYNLGNDSIVVKGGVQIIGEGTFTSRFRYTGKKSAIVLGASSTKGSLTYGVAVKNMGIVLEDKNACGIKLLGTCGAVLENVYIEGPITTNRNTVGVKVSGANASSFFNTFINVICNHLQTSYVITGQPPMVPTTSLFLNCTALGDNFQGSTGFLIDSYCGEGSNIIGGNIEACETGIKVLENGKSLSVQGLRFESNKVDIFNGRYSRGSTYIGCTNISKVQSNAGTGYDANTFIGCTKPDGSPFENNLNASMIIGRQKDDIPLSIINYPMTEQPSLKVLNSSNQKLFEIDQNGSISNLSSVGVKILAGNGSPEGRVVAPVGSLYLQSDGSVGSTFWVKETGNNNKGWKAK